MHNRDLRRGTSTNIYRPLTYKADPLQVNIILGAEPLHLAHNQPAITELLTASRGASAFRLVGEPAAKVPLLIHVEAHRRARIRHGVAGVHAAVVPVRHLHRRPELHAVAVPAVAAHEDDPSRVRPCGGARVVDGCGWWGQVVDLAARGGEGQHHWQPGRTCDGVGGPLWRWARPEETDADYVQAVATKAQVYVLRCPVEGDREIVKRQGCVFSESHDGPVDESWGAARRFGTG